MKSGFLFSWISIFSITQTFSQVNAITIPVERNIVDGLEENIGAGDTLFLESGERKEILFKNLTGTREKPVVIINKAGKVIIDTEKDYGIFLDNSIHCKVTGTGGKDKYGIEIASTKNHGLVFAEFSTDCEADHIEIQKTAYAGIVAKTDPNCARKDLRFFTMKNLSFHDNYIHDTYAEGFYVGYSWYPVREFTCGSDSLLYPHQIHSVRIYNNILENTGQEGIQVGGGTRDVKIYNNRIHNYGTNNERWQNHGLQIGQGTTGELFNNIIDKGPAEGISLFGGGNNYVYCNTVMNTGSSAIYQNDRNAVTNSSYHIFNNKFINNTGKVIVLTSDKTSDNSISGNLIITDFPDSAIVDEGKIRWKNVQNKIVSKKSNARGWDSHCDSSMNYFIPFVAGGKDTMRSIMTDGDFWAPANNNTPLLLINSKGIKTNATVIKKKKSKIRISLSMHPDSIYYLSLGDELYRVVKKSKTS